MVRYLGDCARTPSSRLPLGDAGIIETTVALINKDPHPIDFDVQALRVLGNLCIDRDQNRQRVLDSGVLGKVVPLFEKNDKILNMMLCGFCLNSTMDFDPIQKALSEQGGVASLCDVLSTGETGPTDSMALKALDNMMGQEEGRAAFLSNQHHLDKLLAVFTFAWKMEQLGDLDIVASVADILLQVLMDDDKAQQAVVASGKLPDLMAFLGDDVTLGEDLQDDREEMDKLLEIKRTVSKVIIYATSSDDLIEQLYQDQQFLSQLLQMANSNSEVIQLTGINIIGNLARTDKQCIDLVKTHRFETLLVDLYKTTDNAILQNIILGCLKHLCLPKENKTTIGNTGAIEMVATLLDPSKDMVKRNQFFTIGILKLLCTSNISNTRRVLQYNTQENRSILDMLVAFLQRVDDVAAKSETTRVFIQLVKSVWSQPDDHTLRQQLLQAPIVNAIIEMIRTSKYPVLKNDGIIALTVMLADHDSYASKDMLSEVLPLLAAEAPAAPLDEDKENAKPPTEDDEPRSFLQVIVDDISLAGLPIEIRCNTCVMLENAIKVSIAECLRLSNVTEAPLVPFIQKITLALD
ncbi:armadillo-type protein [Chlamydoabsidia padenii]|nr:armadillo-type protein [Chlamydoabsidia padenii]